MRLLFTLALVAAAVPASLPAAHASTTTTPACRTSALVVWIDTHGDGAAGSTFYHLEFTNLSGSRCTLTGYPGVSAVDLAGRRLGSPAARDPATGPRTVTLAAGRTVTSVLQIADAGVFAPAACRPVTAAGLRVYPPGRRRSKVIPFPFRACSRSGPAYLHVRAVTPNP
jgi:hypothetical protein